MMTNLFSMFDPSNYYASAGWALMMTPIILIKKMKKKLSKKLMAISNLLSWVKSEIMSLSKGVDKKCSTNKMKGMFLTVMTLNMLAILPMNFTPTAHMSITIYLSMSMWTATMMNGVSNSMDKMLTHLTPMGTPTALMSFMVLIELISNMIRPITLAVRLMANMVAGHLLMSLLSSLSMSSMVKAMLSFTPMEVLVALESAVAIIQAYVITILICLYLKETF